MSEISVRMRTWVCTKWAFGVTGLMLYTAGRVTCHWLPLGSLLSHSHQTQRCNLFKARTEVLSVFIVKCSKTSSLPWKIEQCPAAQPSFVSFKVLSRSFLLVLVCVAELTCCSVVGAWLLGRSCATKRGAAVRGEDVSACPRENN